MKIIKSLLEEQLEQSLRMRQEYEKALAGLPRGALVKKYVKGRQYCYLMTRERGKVSFAYKGKLMGRDIKQHESAKTERARYRKLLADVKRKITFIRRTLRTRDLSSLP